MDPISLIGLIASSTALVGTATNITKGFHALLSHYKDIPQCINDLFHEHRLVAACLDNFQKFLVSNKNDPHDAIVAGIRNQAHEAASETQKTLDELHGKIRRFLPMNQSAIKRATLRISWRYAWKERSLQAIMHRLQMRRDALSVIMQLWATNDAAKLRVQMALLQTTLQNHLINLRQPNPTPQPGPVPIPGPVATGSDPGPSSQTDAQPADDTNEADVDDASSTSSAETNSTTLTMPHGPTAGQRFMTALTKAHASGPLGDAVHQKMQQLNALKVAAEFAASPQLKGLVSALVEKEIAPSGLCAPESAAALYKLAKAYQDMGDYDTALEYYHEALIANEQALGATHPTTLNTMDSIASLFELAGLWDDALAYWLQCLEGFLDSAKFGANHPTTLATRLRTARARSMGGNHDEALSDLAGLLSFYGEGPRANSTQAKEVRREKAKVQARQGKYQDALEGYRALLREYEAIAKSRRDTFGPRDRRTRETEDKVAELKQDIAAAEQPPPPPPLAAPLPVAPLSQQAASSTRAAAIPPAIGRAIPRQATNSSTSTVNSTTDGNSMFSVAPSTPSTPSTPMSPLAPPPPPPPPPPPAGDNNDSLVIRAYHEKLKQVREKKGNLHPDTLELMCDLAGAYASHDKHELAIGWYKEALKGQQRALPAGHPVVATTVYNMAKSYMTIKDLKTALGLFQRALADREARFPRDHPETLAVVLAIGSIYTTDGFCDFPQAMQLVKRAVDGFTKRFGPSHGDTLSAQFQMAQIHMQRDHFAQSIQLHELVLAQRVAKLGANHHTTLTSKSCLAQVYSKNGNGAKATALWKDVLDGRTRNFGRTHSSTTFIAEQLATTYWNDNQWRDAIPYWEWVLEGIRHEQPTNEAATVVVLGRIAHCHYRTDNVEQALELLGKVLAIHERHPGSEHDAAAIETMDEMARMYSATDRPVEAINLFRKVLAAREATLPDGHDDVAYPILLLSRSTYDVNQREECLLWTTRLLAIPEGEAPTVVTTEVRLAARRRMGLVYLLENQPEQAIEVYQSLLEDARATLPADHWINKVAPKELVSAHNMSLGQLEAVSDLAERRDRARQLLDTDKPSAIAMLAHLARVHLKETEYSEAAALYEEVIDLIQELETRKLLGFDDVVDDDDDDDDGPNMTQLKHVALSELADAHLKLANHDRALSLLGLLADSEQDRSFRHGALIRMGNLREDMGEYALALEIWNVLLDEIRQPPPPPVNNNDNSTTNKPGGSEGMSGPFNELRIMRRIASLHCHMGDRAEALRWGEGILKGFRNLAAVSPASAPVPTPTPSDDADGNDSDEEEEEEPDTPLLQVLRTQRFLSSIHFSLGNYEEGIAAGKEAAEGFERELGPTRKLTLEAALYLAEKYAMLEWRPQALAWYNKVLAGYETEVGRRHHRMQDGESRRVTELAERLGVPQAVQ